MEKKETGQGINWQWVKLGRIKGYFIAVLLRVFILFMESLSEKETFE